MRNKGASLLTFLVLLSLLFSTGGSVLAQEPEPPDVAPNLLDADLSQNPLETLRGRAVEGDTPAPLDPELRDKEGTVGIVIELQDAPAAVVYAQAQEMSLNAAGVASATRQRIARIDAAQQDLLTAMSELDIEVIYRVQRVYNGIGAYVDADELDEIRNLAGVKAIHPLVPKTLDHTTSVQLLKAAEVWEGVEGATGEGISIAIIDSGVDYIHADFGGPATQAAYAANDPKVIDDTYMGNPLFPTIKVVGGYDFVGDDYDASGDSGSPIPDPDPDPLPCQTGGAAADHGTHVAGSAAGYGVTTAGETYTGTYDTTLDWDQFRIGPGTAPEAEIYALRVFGCDGSTALTDAAIEWAVDPNQDGDFDDHMDVINMSLGSPYGVNYDSSAVASNYAVLAGVVVVASAGNSGDAFYVTGSPGSATRVVSVASSRDSGAIYDGMYITPTVTGEDPVPVAFNTSFDWDTMTQPISGTVVYPETQPTGCEAFTFTNTQLISGNVALMNWTEPSCGGSYTRCSNAYAAGATGCILVDNSVVFDLFIYGSPYIPSVSAPKELGDAIKTALNGGTEVTVTFDSDLRSVVRYQNLNIEDTLSDFSSRGPRRGDSFLKPDIAAPGDTIFSAYNGTGTEGLSYNGTSMAAPHVAGAMAVMRELYPTWTVEELKALVMNTAAHDILTDPPAPQVPYNPSRVGAGRLDMAYAASSDVILYNADMKGGVNVSFGSPEVLGTYTDTYEVVVVNKGSTDAEFDVGYQSYADIPGVEFTISDSTVNLTAGSQATLMVTMTADADLMTHSYDPGLEIDFGADDVPHWLSEESGYLVLTSTTVITPPFLRLPLYAAPRPISDMEAIQTEFDLTQVGAGTVISLTGQDLDAGGVISPSVPTDTLSIVSAFELAQLDSGTAGTIMDSADLMAVGVTNNYVAAGEMVSDTTIFFGIATYGEHNSADAGDTEFDIWIDIDEDGFDDYVILNSTTGFPGDPTDVFVTQVINLATGDLYDSQFTNYLPANVMDTAIFNNNVIIVPVAAADIGLSDANADFDYQIVSYVREIDGSVDSTPYLSYTAGMPGIDFSSGGLAGGPLWLDMDGEVISMTFSAGDYFSNASEGILLFHHHNGMGNRVEVLDVTYVNVYLPLVMRNY